MNNKKSTYILLPVVIAIWGIIILKLFWVRTTTNKPESTTNTIPVINKTNNKQRKTVSITVNYRDPFLGKTYSSFKNKSLNGNTLKPTKIAVPATPFQWPSIVYKGLVSDSNNKSKVFMVAINNRMYIIAEKGTEEGVTIVKGNTAEIDVKYKNQTNKIQIQQ